MDLKNEKLFCERLANICPAAEKVLKEHINDNDELLPYIFLARIADLVLSEEEGSEEIIQFLEQGCCSENEDIQNLIALGFVENIETEADLNRIMPNAMCLRTEWYKFRKL